MLVLSILAFYVIVWFFVAREDEPPPTVVQYGPPPGLSPAAVGYLAHRGYDARQFTATLLSLAGQGVLEIERDRSRTTIRRAGPLPANLSLEERAVAQVLLPDDAALVILGISHSRLRASKRALRRTLKAKYRGRFVTANREWLLGGVVLSLTALGVRVQRTTPGLLEEIWVIAAAVGLGFVGVWTVLVPAYRRWKIDLAEMSPKPSVLAASIFPLLTILPLGLLVLLAHRLYQSVPVGLLFTGFGLIVVNVLFSQALRRPTAEGRVLVSHVDGLKLFLTATEGDRVERMHRGEPAALYERLLPFAISLGLKNEWTAAFQDDLNGFDLD